MKHKILGVAALLCAIVFTSCSDLIAQLTKEIQKEGIISYATTEVSKTTDNADFTNELTNNGDGTVSYTSNKTDVATVNDLTGKVTIVGAGTATITATVTDSENYTYAVKTASYSLTVTQASGIISYATTEVNKTNADSDFTNELTITGDGTVTYASSNEAVATVNATTGEVTILGAGETTITATVADSEKYTYAVKTASYTVTIVPEGFVKVAGGTFDGTSTLTPESEVFISGRSLTIGDLYVCDHEVTEKEYATYCKFGGSQPSASYGVGNTNWYDAIVYCNLRSIDEGLTPAYTISGETDPNKWADIESEETDGVTKYCGPYSSNDTWNAMTFDTTANGYRLPTEAEWEYIARGGSEWKEYTYSGSDTIDDVAWYYSNVGGKTHEIKTKAANTLGIYDMSGNKWEWCWDWYGTINTDTCALGAASGSYRVARGGSSRRDASLCTVAYRTAPPV